MQASNDAGDNDQWPFGLERESEPLSNETRTIAGDHEDQRQWNAQDPHDEEAESHFTRIA
jgi:hypothetical protein